MILSVPLLDKGAAGERCHLSGWAGNCGASESQPMLERLAYFRACLPISRQPLAEGPLITEFLMTDDFTPRIGPLYALG